MRVVNLASRPFVNRRPVRRIAAFLWVLGAILFGVALWLYGAYLQGTTVNRAKLAEIDAENAAAEEAVSAVASRLQRLDLAERNARVEFLNGLIEKRTFPWSRLFDDLEDVLLDDIYLQTVTPELEEEDEDRGGARRKVITPAEARERARRERTGEASPQATEAVETVEEPKFVTLGLVGIARDDDALLDFVDVLYASQRFHQPYLSSETREAGGREVSFQISVDYRLPPTPPPPEMPELTEEAAEGEISSAEGGPRAPTTAPTTASTTASTTEPKPQAETQDGRPAPPDLAAEGRARPTPGSSQPADRTEPPRHMAEGPASTNRRSEDRSPSARETSTSSPAEERETLRGTPTIVRPAPPSVDSEARPGPTRGESAESSRADRRPELSEPAASAARTLRPGGSGGGPERRPEP